MMIYNLQSMNILDSEMFYRCHFIPGDDETLYSLSSESIESKILHCTCPVLCEAQLIHRPSYRPTAVMMASPAYDDCFHWGKAVVEMMPIQPPNARK